LTGPAKLLKPLHSSQFIGPVAAPAAPTVFVSRFAGPIVPPPAAPTGLPLQSAVSRFAGSRFVGQLAAAVPPVSKFFSETSLIPPSIRRLRALWKSKHFWKPFS